VIQTVYATCAGHVLCEQAMARRTDIMVTVALLLMLSGGVQARADAPTVTVAQSQSDDEKPAAPALGERQTASEVADDSDRLLSLRCPDPARAWRHWECVGQAIGEPLTRWGAEFRRFLGTLGIVTVASYTAQLMGNPIGGRQQGFTYAGSLDALIAWDLQRLLRVPGLSFTISANWSTGKGLSFEDIDNIWNVQSAFTGPVQVSLQQMYLEQQFLDGNLSIAAGRLAAANTFATLPVFYNYLNSAINPVAGALSFNDLAFSQSPPGVEWGAQIVYKPIVPLQIALGVYDTNPFAAAGANHGVDFSFQEGNKGILTVVQLTYRLNHGKGDTGLPGEYAIGALYDTNAFDLLDTGSGTVSGNYVVYAMFQQMVYRDGDVSSRRGLTLWGEVTISPRQSASLIPYFVGGGLSYRGLVPTRGKDIASLGAISGIFSRHVRGASAETVIEANYYAALPYGLSVTPDVQYVIKPSGSSRIKNALVLGVQLAVTF